MHQIIRAFSEATTGSVEEIEVREISASDPMFFLGIDARVIVAIAGAFSWALHTWKSVEEIRKLRAETEKLESFKKKEIEAFFGEKINEIITSSIKQQTDSILKAISDAAVRKNEQRTSIKWALDSILSRVERGMTVEIRMLPPATAKDKNDVEIELPAEFQELKKLIPQLIFPQIKGSPVLKLPPSEPPTHSEAGNKRKAT